MLRAVVQNLKHLKLKFSFGNFMCALLLFSTGIGVGIIINKNTNTTTHWFSNVREESPDYKFIHPLLFVDTSDQQTSPEYATLKNELEQYIQKATANNKASRISVYYRNLNGSQRFSINPENTFSPASMLKVITLISVLRAAESDPNLLSKVITLEGNDRDATDSQVYYPAKDPIESNRSYTVYTLLEHLIIESDNVANEALIKFVGDDNVLRVYSDLRLPKPDSTHDSEYTAEQYSHLFRALYNGTYLTRASSENALNLLSQTSFDKGLTAGIPKSTTVSHKFGVKTMLSDNGGAPTYRELHDCGIVYYPEAPYFVCVMTHGSDFRELEKIISDISSLVWKDTDRRHH